MNWLRLDEDDNTLHSSDDARRHLNKLSKRDPLSLIAIFGAECRMIGITGYSSAYEHLNKVS